MHKATIESNGEFSPKREFLDVRTLATGVSQEECEADFKQIMKGYLSNTLTINTEEGTVPYTYEALLDRGQLVYNRGMYEIEIFIRLKRKHNSHKEVQNDIYRLISEGKKLESKCCYWPDCNSNDAISSHSIQRAALSELSLNGKIYTRMIPRAGFVTKKIKSMDDAPVLVGISDASTFHGFCKNHDSIGFAPIELHPIAPTDEQAALLHFRAVCFGLHTLNSLRGFGHRSLSSIGAHSGAIRRWLNLRDKETEIAYKSYLLFKDRMANWIKTRDFSDIRWICFRLKSRSPISCASQIEVPIDFSGKPLRYKRQFVVGEVTMSVVPNQLGKPELGSSVLIAWMHADITSKINSMFNYLWSLGAQAASLHLSLMACQMCQDNTYISPSWWNGLKDSEKEIFIQNSKIDPNNPSYANSQLAKEFGFFGWTIEERILHPGLNE